MKTTTSGYKVVYLGAYARRIEEPSATLPNAESRLKSLKRQGRTAWIETSEGIFFPVKGAMRKPAELA